MRPEVVLDLGDGLEVDRGRPGREAPPGGGEPGDLLQDRLPVELEQATGQRLSDPQIRVLMARFGIKLSLGPGLYVALAGGLVGAAGGALGLAGRGRLPDKPPPPSEAPPG